MDDIDAILAQSPEGTTKETAAEVLTLTGGNIAESITMLWDQTKKQAPISLDTTQNTWTSVRDIADSLADARNIRTQNTKN
jgi:hypothetical protein